MKDNYTPTKEEVKKFLDKIEKRIKQNYQKRWKPQKHEPRL